MHGSRRRRRRWYRSAAAGPSFGWRLRRRWLRHTTLALGTNSRRTDPVAAAAAAGRFSVTNVPALGTPKALSVLSAPRRYTEFPFRL